jgi:hypothetical protein
MPHDAATTAVAENKRETGLRILMRFCAIFAHFSTGFE